MKIFVYGEKKDLRTEIGCRLKKVYIDEGQNHKTHFKRF